jgi:N-methylhydantoinase A
VRTVYMMTDQADPAALEQAFAALEAEGAAMLDRAGIPSAQRRFERTVDARYARQSYELSVSAPAGRTDAAAVAAIADAFHDRHAKTYGHANRSDPVQLVSLRVAAIGVIPPLAIRHPPAPAGTDAVKGRRSVWIKGEGAVEAAVIDRARMPEGFTVAGPAVIESLDSTILVPPPWTARMDANGFVILSLAAASART